MKFQKEMLLLYAVTDRAWSRDKTLYAQVEEVLVGGATMVQLREKEMSTEELIREAADMRELCHRYGVPLIVNDNVEAAIKSGADGVHVGMEDMPVKDIRAMAGEDFIIGATAKTVEQAREAEVAGADYLGVGAVFPSPTKRNAIRITTEELRRICDAVSIPVVAIGGIGPENIGKLAGGGMAGVAVVSALFGAADSKEAARELKNLSETMVRSGRMKKVLTIAGSDSSGGAGIQADIKTMLANGVYAMSAITALTAQNTTGVRGILEVSPEFLAQQIDAVFEDIFPDAVKIGMVSSEELIGTIAERLRFYGAGNIVVDPVMVATSGSRLMKSGAVTALERELFPMATLVTPNIPEAEVLSGKSISGRENLIEAARSISETYGCAVLVKGGHLEEESGKADDLLYADGVFCWFEGRRIDNPNTHGTGCTLSSAIAANLAKGYGLAEAVSRAKEYISGALGAMLDLGSGSGPMDHGFDMESEFTAGPENH